MVDKTEFTDHAGLKQDQEILQSLDKQRNGKPSERNNTYRKQSSINWH